LSVVPRKLCWNCVLAKELGFELRETVLERAVEHLVADAGDDAADQRRVDVANEHDLAAGDRRERALELREVRVGSGVAVVTSARRRPERASDKAS